MNVAEFVPETLVGVLDGVRQANARLLKDVPEDKRSRIFQLLGVGRENSTMVQFDIAVTTSTSAGGEATAKGHIAVLGVSMAGTVEAAREHVSRIKFEVGVNQDRG